MPGTARHCPALPGTARHRPALPGAARPLLAIARPRESDALESCQLADTLTCDDAPAVTWRWTFAGDELRLDGRRGGAALTVTLRRAPEGRLLATPFEWRFD